jgi:uncharacterized protein YkwD
VGAGLRVRPALFAAAVLAAVLAGCSPSAEESPSGPVTLGDPATFARALFDASNEERAAAGLPELEWSDCLADAAVPRAANSLGTAPLTHEPLPSPCTPGVTAGENLSRTWRTAEAVVGLWMDSEAHRANILNPAFVSSGVACVAYSYADPAVAVTGDAPQGGMVCSQLFEGE